MAQTSRKRRTKHRGNAAGVVEARGRTGRPPSPEERKKAARTAARERRLRTPPSWNGALKKGVLAAALVFVALLLTSHPKHGTAIVPAAIGALLALLIYVPAGFYFDAFMYRRHLSKQSAGVK